jgi:glycosyltransferase involved in cell wall biosynthesis
VRFLFVTPRYGAEIVAGPEHACRLMAELVCRRHDVNVVTTCARTPLTWRNDYAEGTDRVRGVLVRRFAVDQPHDEATFQPFSERVLAGGQSRQDETEWARQLGPSSPALIEYIKRQHRSFDALIFFSLLHYTTVQGLAAAPDRSVLFPHLQLHPALRFGLWSDLARSARALGYISAAEQSIARPFLGVAQEAEEVVGIGVHSTPQQTYPRHQQDPGDNPQSEDEIATETEATLEPEYLAGRGVPFRRRHRLYKPFALYGGRVESDNGCEEMLEYFDSFSSADRDTMLILMGVKLMKVPEAPYLSFAGVLPDRERMVAYEAADVTLAPATADLFAQPVLESLAVGTPVLTAAMNRAAVEHCRRSNAGLYYANRDEFVAALRLMMGDARLREKMGENGRRYVEQHYSPEAVLGRFDRLVTRVKGR